MVLEFGLIMVMSCQRIYFVKNCHRYPSWERIISEKCLDIFKFRIFHGILSEKLQKID